MADKTLNEVFWRQRLFYDAVLRRLRGKKLGELTADERRDEVFEYVAWAHEELCEIRRALRFKLWDTDSTPDWNSAREEVCDVLLFAFDIALACDIKTPKDLSALLQEKQDRNLQRLRDSNG